jgi:hypothetical protein
VCGGGGGGAEGDPKREKNKGEDTKADKEKEVRSEMRCPGSNAEAGERKKERVYGRDKQAVASRSDSQAQILEVTSIVFVVLPPLLFLSFLRHG